MSNTIKLNDLTAIVSPSVNAEFWVYDPEASFPRDRKLTFSNLYNRIKVAINNETPTLNLNITGNSATVTSGVYLTGTQTITGAKTFTATASFNSVNINQDLTISGNLTVNGTQTILNTQTLSVEDNIIEINRGLEGTPSSGLESGILVNRGDSPDYKFIFREIDNTFVIGESGDEQVVATRDDNPEENGIAFWNDTDKRFDTSERIIWNDDEYDSELLINGDVKIDGELEVDGFFPSIIPGHYSRNVSWRVKGYDTAENRRTLVSPDRILTKINDGGYVKGAAVELDINNTSSWDDTATTDWTVAANRAGKDFYIYLCVPSSGFDPDIVLSPNATIPDGYTASNSRKVGQFHCLCEDVLTNVYPYENEGNDENYVAAAYVNSSLSNGDTQHWMEGMITGDILPFSVQDLLHRPHDGAGKEGRTYDPGKDRWVYIYLPSWDAASKRLVSVYGGTIADGASSPAFHQYRFQQVFGRQGEMLPDQGEFVSLSLGSPQGVNVAGSADQNTTGGHTATNDQRIVSLIGVEDATGVIWQWGREGGATNVVGSSWADAYDGNDKNVAGQHYEAPNRPIFGGAWGSGAHCGSRGSEWSVPALYSAPIVGARGVAEPYGGRA